MEKNKKIRIGTAVSDKMHKSILVEVERTQKHRIYGKRIRRVSKYNVHDENNDCVVGDNVSIIETRPISKTKRWRVLNINKKSEMNQQDLSPLTEENTIDNQAEGE